jgi:glycosyltransferase involved in cell wall biosynthesis
VRRVLLVFEPREGGVPEHVLQLSMGLRARGWEVDVAGPASSPFMSRFDDLDVAVHALPFERGSVAGDASSARELRRIDRERRFDVVHAHSSKAGALVRAAIGGGRVVYSPHCFAFNRQTSLPTRVFTWAVEQALVPRTRVVIAACDWERRQGSRVLRGVARRTEVIEYGVEPCGDQQPDTALREFAAGGPLAGFIGRLEPQKDPVHLVRAFAAAVEAGAPGKLALVGNGPLADAVTAEIAHRGLDERARLFPFRPGRTREYLRAFDLFVLGSRWEALPISMLEAMSCGVAVLVTSVGGVPDLLDGRRGGRVVPPEDEDALASQLRELLDDDALRGKIAAEGHELAQTRFARERMVGDVEALYLRLLDEQP